MGMVFCRGCGKEIHESAPMCPHCGAPQGNSPSQVKLSYSSWDQVPWFRKNWFAIVCALFFAPGLLFVLFTGDIYYQKKGELKTFSKGRKIFLIVWCIFIIIKIIYTLSKD
jgi:uncharacterized membrane protein YvbJ